MDFGKEKGSVQANQPTMSKPIYFDGLVWDNIISYVDPRPPKQTVFTNGIHYAKHHSNMFDKKIKVVGRTRCFVKIEEIPTQGIEKVEYRKKIFMKDGIETIQIGTGTSSIKITAYDKCSYNYTNKEEMIKNEKCIQDGTPSEPESDDEYYDERIAHYRRAIQEGESIEDACITAGFDSPPF
jgi:hypothetical protein